MITARGETYELKRFARKENSPYEWEDYPDMVFFGRMASPVEKKKYRVIQGVNSGTDSTYVLTSNLPDEVKIGDKILFLGKEWTVESVGYYFKDSRVVNNKIMDDKYLMKRSPKGITLL